jgi:filamentous hemagglutinin family protein
MMAHSYPNAIRAVLAGVLLYGAGLLVSVSHADVTPSGLGTVVNQPAADVFDITGGTRPGGGANLFHGFGDFSLDAAQSGNFINDSGLPTTNILGRVTGGNPSNIFGMIDSSSFAGANLFLMNPAGILFGPTAQLNVDGSFHATTADYIGLADGQRFNAVPSPADALLSAAPPSAFGFLTANPAAIDVQAGELDFATGTFANVLQVPDGQTMSFVGGPVNVGPPPGSFPPAGFLLASQGRINLVSVASAGEAAFDGTGFNVDGFAQLGNINITGNSLVDARDVFIRGGQLTIDGAIVFPGFFFLFGAPVAPPDGGEVNIQVSDNISIIGQPPFFDIPGIRAFAGAPFALIPGDVPDVNITARSLSITDGAEISVARFGPNNPGSLSIDADVVELRNGGNINTINFFEGPGGTIAVNATDVTLDSEEGAGLTGIFAQSLFHPAYGAPGVPFFPFFQFADSGSITVNAAGTLTALGSSQITTDSRSFGNSGNVTINAGDALLVGAGVNTGLIGAQSGLAGRSGNVTLNVARTIDIQNGFRISTNTLGSADGGTTSVTAGQSITMAGEFTQISSRTEQPLDNGLTAFAQLFGEPDYPSLRDALGVAESPNDLMDVLAALRAIAGPGGVPLVAVTDFTPGEGGTVSISTPVLTVSADARLETSTTWDGNAGTIAANVGSLLVDSGGSIRSRSGLDRLDRGLTAGTGNAGTIDVTATDTIAISGRSPTSGEGSFVSTSTFGDGDGGDISLSAGSQVQIADGGLVSADSLAQVGTGTGLTGNITITAGTDIAMNNGTISTEAVTSDGGNIKLTAPNIVQLTGSQITTSVESGVGGGGNINIDPQFITLNKSQVTANAFGGPGGNITLVANNFLPSADSFLGLEHSGHNRDRLAGEQHCRQHRAAAAGYRRCKRASARALCGKTRGRRAEQLCGRGPRRVAHESGQLPPELQRGVGTAEERGWSGVRHSPGGVHEYQGHRACHGSLELHAGQRAAGPGARGNITVVLNARKRLGRAHLRINQKKRG